MSGNRKTIAWVIAGVLILLLVYFALQGGIGATGSDGANNAAPTGEYATGNPEGDAHLGEVRE